MFIINALFVRITRDGTDFKFFFMYKLLMHIILFSIYIYVYIFDLSLHIRWFVLSADVSRIFCGRDSSSILMLMKKMTACWHCMSSILRGIFVKALCTSFIQSYRAQMFVCVCGNVVKC